MEEKGQGWGSSQETFSNGGRYDVKVQEDESKGWLHAFHSPTLTSYVSLTQEVDSPGDL